MGTRKENPMSYQRLTLLLACLLLPSVAALGTIPVKGTMKDVDLRVHPTSYTGRGPAHFHWTGDIRVNPHSGPMTVQYHWVRSDKATSGDTDIVLNPGVDSYQVAYDWELGPFSGSEAKGHVNVQLCVKVTDGGAGARNSSLANAQYDFVQLTRK
jgi:hypothetical protein